MGGRALGCRSYQARQQLQPIGAAWCNPAAQQHRDHHGQGSGNRREPAGAGRCASPRLQREAPTRWCTQRCQVRTARCAPPTKWLRPLKRAPRLACGLAGFASSARAYFCAAAVRHSYASSGCCGLHGKRTRALCKVQRSAVHSIQDRLHHLKAICSGDVGKGGTHSNVPSRSSLQRGVPRARKCPYNPASKSHQPPACQGCHLLPSAQRMLCAASHARCLWAGAAQGVS